LAEKIKEYGADIIVGHHQHLIQSCDTKDDYLKIFCLGNFINDQFIEGDGYYFDSPLYNAVFHLSLDKKEDGNKTTLDYNFDVEPSKEYKARVHAQTKGYASTQEEENKIEKNAEFGDDFYKQAKDSNMVLNQKEEDFKKTGLQACKQPKDTFKKKNMYENKLQTVRFKRTSFLTEEHMISKIPDEMKVEGKRFKMVDMNENTYVCEWVKNQYNGKESATIIENHNPKKIDESIEKMKKLYTFKVGEKTTKTTTNNRLYENNEGLISTLNNMRKLIK
jgi:hypothetical protein